MVTKKLDKGSGNRGTYRGLKQSDMEKILYSGGGVPARLDDVDKSYIEKALNVHDFYDGRMLQDGNLAAENVLKSKYLGPGETGPLHIWHRLADSMSSVEKGKKLKEKTYYDFMEVLDDFKLVPGGRIMHGGGRDDISTTLNNCYVVAIKKDSLDSIYETLTDDAMTFKKGGGSGTNISILRPSDVSISGTGGFSCGPVGFMELFSVNTNTIAQHGRRGAKMVNMSDWHPDINAFIESKSKSPKDIEHANISVLLGHDFMDALEKKGEFDLIFPDIEKYSGVEGAKEFYEENWDGDIGRWKDAFALAQEDGILSKDLNAVKVHSTVQSKDLWDNIVKNAHANAEPGILFWDTMRDFHNLEYCSPLSSTNPCGEQPLSDGGCCNLAAVNLERMVSDDGLFDNTLFEKTIRTGVRFLDNVIDYNIDRHALESQKENAISDRRIGLGITGLADMLIRMGVRYDSDEGLETVDKIMEFKLRVEYDESINLAEEKGSFENYNWEGLSQSKFIQNLPEDLQKRIETVGLRNGTINTAAPVGSGSMVAESTSGIEPMFSISYERDVKTNEGDEVDTYEVFHPLVEKLFGRDSSKVPDYVVEAHTIDPLFRVKMQGVIQKHIDTSISSTINLPEDVSTETVADIYLAAYHEGLKGVTVYREGSRDGVMRTSGLETAVSGDNLKGILEDVVSHEKFELSDILELNDGELYTDLVVAKMNGDRPEIVGGVTEKVNTPHGLPAFVTLNSEMDEGGNFVCHYESFVNVGKAGGDIGAITEGYGRLVSLALQAGIPIEDITEQLEGIGGETQSGFGEKKVKSLPDSIGKALRRAQKKVTGFSSEGDSEIAEEEKKATGTLCSNCQNFSVVREEGCQKCFECGDSKC
jgi:ribonucleoside-diphosphate reductase alpha chain